MLKISMPCFVALLFIQCVNAQKQLPIVVNGSSKYSIVTPASADTTEIKAATVLQNYISKISNCKIPIQHTEGNSDAYQIIIGTTNKLDSKDTSGLGDDGIIIKSDGNSLILSGGKRKGVLYSVYTFLSDYLGCKSLATSVIEVPHNSSITLNSPLYKKTAPVFNYRMIYYLEGTDKQYCDWHGINYFMEGWGLWVHSFKILLPPDQYFALHPEYYALVNGKRTPDQLNLTNPDVLRIVTANLKKMMDANPTAKYWSVSQNDNNNYCQCPDCKKLDDEQGSHQGSLLTFINAIAKQFPDKIISTLAYGYSVTPPKTLRPEKNVMIMLTTAKHDRRTPLTETPNDPFNQDFKKWATLTDNLFVWDYIAGYGHALSPYPNLYTLQPNIQYFAANGASAVFEEGIGNFRGEFSELKTYLLSELMWNKDIDANATINRFVNDFYGQAGGLYILQYINLLKKNADNSNAKLTPQTSPADAKNTYLSNNNLNSYKDIFKKALAASGNDSVHTKRIMKEYLSVLYAELENNKPSQTNALQKASFNKDYYINLLNEWYRDTKITNITNINEAKRKTDDYYQQYIKAIQ